MKPLLLYAMFASVGLALGAYASDPTNRAPAPTPPAKPAAVCPMPGDTTMPAMEMKGGTCPMTQSSCCSMMQAPPAK